MKTNLIVAHTVLALLMTAGAANAASIAFSDDFDVDSTANWTVNDPALTDKISDFYYDYSQIGVPAAPGGATTRGLKMTANNTGGVFGGFSVSPTGQSFSGNYQVKFNLWQNYVGPLGPGGNGTTQLSTFGIGSSGTTAFWPGAAVKESVSFAATLDGGSASDYRAYSSAAPTSYASGNAVYQAPGGTINDSGAYYMAAFPSNTAPAAQLGLFAGQTGSTNAGEISFAWREVTIDVINGFATWSVDGTAIAKVDLSTVTLGGSNILFGHSDSNAGASTDPNDSLLNVTLIDNIVVTVPEPTSLSLLGLSVVGLLLGRARR
jgi:hypothetical protein